MDLSYGAEYEAFREEVKTFLSENWNPEGPDGGRPDQGARDAFREKAVERGYRLRSIPKKYGGLIDQSIEDWHRGSAR